MSLSPSSSASTSTSTSASAAAPTTALAVVVDGGLSAAAMRRRFRGSATEVFVARSSGLLNRALFGLAVIGILIVGAGGWGSTAQLTGAVIAPGLLVVDSNVKKIQHAGGGIVSEIRVRNGDRVAAGDLLVRLDETQVRATRGVLAVKQLQLKGEKARLEAERERRPGMLIDEAFVRSDPRAAGIFAAEEALFAARRQLTESQKSRLRQRVHQTHKEMSAIEAQRTAKLREIDLIRTELKAVESLHSRQLTNLTRLVDMQRQLARFEGEHASLTAQLARAESQIAEIELQVLELDHRTMTDAHKEARDVEARIEETAERLLAADDQLARMEIKAPVTGVVHELAVHTVGGVLRAGDTALLIVPDQDALSVDVRIGPTDIDQVSRGQKALLRLSAFNQRTTPELIGQVLHVGADLTREPQSGRAYFTARIAIDEASAARIAGMKLLPGMPVESFIETGQRSALSYLLKPLTDSFARALREP